MGFDQDVEEPGCDGPDARGDGEMHLLLATDRASQDCAENEGGRVRRRGGAARLVYDSVCASVSSGGDCVRKPEGSGKPGFKTENFGPGLSRAAVVIDQAADNLPGTRAESESEY